MSGYRCERIGHGGASAIAPANTLESFDAALEVGVDMVEFDVRAWRGELVLAHTLLDARSGRSLRLSDALRHLASSRFDEVGVNLDIKQTGCEHSLLEQLRRHRLLHRALLSSQIPAVIDALRELDPSVRTGISIGGRLPRLYHRWGDWREQVLRGLQTGRWDALMAQHRLIDDGLLGDVEARGGQLYAWTVNERPAIEALKRLGVHGIATADPRLFGAEARTAA
jgi:glycerophosphoryl diester phosphodiesterase